VKEDPSYFVAWIDRAKQAAARSNAWNVPGERNPVLRQLTLLEPKFQAMIRRVAMEERT